MKKKELLEKISMLAGVTSLEAEKVIDCYLKEVEHAIDNVDKKKLLEKKMIEIANEKYTRYHIIKSKNKWIVRKEKSKRASATFDEVWYSSNNIFWPISGGIHDAILYTINMCLKRKEKTEIIIHDEDATIDKRIIFN